MHRTGPFSEPFRNAKYAGAVRPPSGGGDIEREDQRDREIQSLRGRLSRLSEASLRINESLDFDTVLQGVLDSARALTEARYGVITLLDESGWPQDFLSSGLTSEEAEGVWEQGPEGLRIFEYFNSLQEPLRVSDLLKHIRSMGLPGFQLPVSVSPSLSFLAAPVFHRGERVGNIFLAEKEIGEEFNSEDQETLVLFASQAALVISNARRYREEKRARNDLETLISTSPVGIVVFDARTGAPLSFNREMVRILDDLRLPDSPPEKLLEVLIVRRADGREIFLKEFSMAQLLSSGETVRAEEIVLAMPDGRSVSALMNCSPIRSEKGEVETLVVTMQDMTALQELERLRAEFLAMVSHELRAPLATVKGSVTNLLNPSGALNPTEARQFFQIIDSQTDRMRALISDLLDVARIETGTLSVAPEPTEAASMVTEADNAFRFGGYKHTLTMDLPHDLPWVMADRQRIVQVLGNLLINAARHSPESSTIRVSAVREDYHIAVSVSDDGRGIPAESLPHLFRKFSRIEREDQGGDTGLGLAICKGTVEAHGGRIWAESDGPGLGASFTFTIPTADEAGFVSPAPLVRVSPRFLRQREAGEQVRILAVDDDPEALRYIRDALVKAGYTVIATGDPGDVPRLIEEDRPHLALLDLMLPGVDGIDLMQEIVEAGGMPVIFVSAYGQDQLIARAFEAGASDYVVKPFSPTELVARIRATLRKREVPEPAGPYVLGDLAIDYVARRVTLAGSPVRLTPIEYRTLAELSVNAGRVLSYEHLLQRVWDADPDADVRPMRTVISTLRRRLGDNSDNPTYIFTEPRVGYRMPKGEARDENVS